MTDLDVVLKKLEEIRDADKTTSNAVSALNGEVKALGQQMAGLEAWMKSHSEKHEDVDKEFRAQLGLVEKEARRQLDEFAGSQRDEISGLKDRVADAEGIIKLLKLVVGAMVVPVLGMMGFQLFKVMAGGAQ